MEEGQFFCENCQQIFPILHGIPILVPDIQTYLSNSQIHVLMDERMSFFTRQWLAETAGPSSAFELTRQYLSTYCWTHYGDLDRDASGPESHYLQLISQMNTQKTDNGPQMEIGCSVGRGVFEIAHRNQVPTLGVDLNFSMIRVATKIMRQKRLRYGLRKIGITYDWKDYEVNLPGADLVDFWVADALCLPFAVSIYIVGLRAQGLGLRARVIGARVIEAGICLRIMDIIYDSILRPIFIKNFSYLFF